MKQDPRVVYRGYAQTLTREVAERVVEYIQHFAPIDKRENAPHPGFLKSSYRVRELPDGSAEIYTTARYWKYVEFGTREHGDAQPHIRPALEWVRASSR
jgi:Bacteriophage HK97-gp10, putative tail-component